MMCTKYAEYAWVNVMTKLHIYALSISSCWCLGSERPTRSPGSGTARVTHDSLSPDRHRAVPVTVTGQGTRSVDNGTGSLSGASEHHTYSETDPLVVWPPTVTARAAGCGPDWLDQQMNGELHPSLSSTVARPSRSDGPTVELLLWLSPGPPAGRACHGGTVPVGCQQSWLERRYIGA